MPNLLRQRAVAVAVALGTAPGAVVAPAAHAAPASSEGDDDAVARARAEYDRASAHFEAEEYLEAARALDRAYALDPNVDYLYKRGHALRMAGNCGAALRVFAEVEAALVSDAQRAAVAEWTAHCKRVLQEAGVEPSPSASEQGSGDDDVGRDPAAADTEAPVSLPRHDIAAGVMLGLGAAASVTGASLLIASASAARGRPDNESEPAWEDRRARVERLEVAGAIVLGIGAVAITAAVARYVVLRRRQRSPRVAFGHGRLWF